METTYRHLSDADAVEHAAAKFEGREPETDSPLTPEKCPTCGEIMDPGAKACSACGTVFTPDAKSVEDNIDTDVKQSYAETDPDDSDQQDKISQLDDLLEDPEVKQALLEKIGDK